MNSAHAANNDNSKRMSDVSVVSLDTLRPAQKLVPGELHELTQGVTISVLQSAAEGLLEVDHEQAGTISVNEKVASELATVQPGQIIKTKEGRFVMVRHLQAIMVPRTPQFVRPEYAQQTIDLAIASLRNRENLLSPTSEHSFMTQVASKTAWIAKPSAPSNESSHSSRKKIVIRSAMAICVAVIVAGYLHQSADSEDQATQKRTETAKSRIVAASQPSDESPSESQQPTVKTSPAPAVTVAGSAKDHPATAPSPRLNMPGGAAPAASALRANHIAKPAPDREDKAASSKVIRLSEKDRQTIAEYKLEARFDRSNARAKLKHFANSFPPGSTARLEVERAYNGL